jgi:hypothetical protein
MPKVEIEIDDRTFEQATALVNCGRHDDVGKAVSAVLRGDDAGLLPGPDRQVQEEFMRVLREARERKGPPGRDEAVVEKWRKRLHGCLGDRTLEDVMDELRGRGRLW